MFFRLVDEWDILLFLAENRLDPFKLRLQSLSIDIEFILIVTKRYPINKF